MIQDRINRLKPYFKGIKVAEDYNIVEVNLKKSWVIPENEDILVQQKEVKESTNIFYNMFYTDVMNFDDLMDYIEQDVIKYNLEIEQKEDLLRMKVEELKRVFENKSLEELNNLKFTTEENNLKLGGNKAVNTLNNKTEKINENGVTEELSPNSQS
jgi:hypothetical protein